MMTIMSQGGMVVQCLALSPHSMKVLGLSPVLQKNSTSLNSSFTWGLFCFTFFVRCFRSNFHLQSN